MANVPGDSNDVVGTENVPYGETSGYEWTERAFVLMNQQLLTASPRYVDGIVSVAVEGQCPRCGHHTFGTWVDTVVTGVSVGARGMSAEDDGPPRVIEVDVTCGCATPHANAPEKVVGCGVSFRVALHVDDEEVVS